MKTKLLSSLLCCMAYGYAESDFRSWQVVGGSAANLHYSALNQVNRSNVSKLRVAWTYDSKDSYQNSNVQCNPIVVGDVMYVTTAKSRIVALNAATGREIWSFNNGGERARHPNRGLAYWSSKSQARILVTIGNDLLSIDAKTGKLDSGFGADGRVDLRAAIDRPKEDVSISVTSPGAIYKDLIILGSSVPEMLPSTPGDIRAYDVRTGELRWTFHTIPHPGEFGYDTWPPNAWKTSGGANNWAGMAVDERRGSVYVPTGSPAFDFYGADRHGDNLFADTLLCLDASTGKRKWHFQAVRHDVWDLDFPSPPTLITVRQQGKLIDAVAQAGKSGYLYVLNRDTGESLFPMQEHAITPSKVDGEQLAKSQLIPTKPAPFVRQQMTDDMATRRTEAAHKAVLDQMKTREYGTIFTPPSLKGTIYMPGLAGGAEWGGSAYDPQTHIYYVNANELPWMVRLVDPQTVHRKARASQLYRARCASCHGPDMKGAPPEYPALDQAATRLTSDHVYNMLRKGGGRMPSFASLGEPAIGAIHDLLMRKTDNEVDLGVRPAGVAGLKYGVEAYRKFLDPDGYPAITPPWGTLSAINLDNGEYLWKVPFGEFPELAAKGMKQTGSENHGGSVVTAGGLLFIGATHYDNKFRAFDKQTGKLLWETVLPFAANATPAVFAVNGKQHIVVAAGGGRERPSGGLFVAFALP